MLNYDSITLLSLLRSSEQQIGIWLTNILPLINNGNIKNITVTCGLKSQYLDVLKKICNINIINVPFNNNNGEDPLLKNKIYRDCWNEGLENINSEYILVIDDDIKTDNLVVNNFINNYTEDNIYYGCVNYKNSNDNLMVSFKERPMYVFKEQIKDYKNIEIYYASPALMFSKTETLKKVALPLNGSSEFPYRCTGFEIANNAKNEGIKQILIPSIESKHG